MARLLIDRPWEIEHSTTAMEEWIAELDEMAAFYEGDDDALADIARERARAELDLVAMREQDAAGIPAPPDDRDEPLA